MMKVLDLFSGIGGFSLGLERTGGFETVAFCEIDPFCRRVLAKHWPGVPIYEDVRTLTTEALSRGRVTPVDVICGGFPCQDISEAGLGAGIDGERSGLWGEYARLIDQLRPRLVIVENVSALLGRGLSRVLGDLAALRMDAWWSCLRSSDIGAPHIRDRVWIVAYPEGSETGRAQSENCQREFEKARAHQAAQIGRRACDLGGHNWDSEPALCRVDDGVSANVDRVGALGNAVVPQIPELIGRAILQAEHDLKAVQSEHGTRTGETRD